MTASSWLSVLLARADAPSCPGVKCGAPTNKVGKCRAARRGNLAFTAFVPPLPLTPEIDCCSEFESKSTNKLKVKMPTTLKEFESVWPRIVADLQDHCKGYNLPKQSLDWFTKVLP